MGPHVAWLLILLQAKLNVCSRNWFVDTVEVHIYHLTEEVLRMQIPDPTSKEEDAIAVASIMLKAVKSTQSWKWLIPERKTKQTPSLRDLHAMEDANYALRHFKASYTGATPFSVLETDLFCLRGIPQLGLRKAQRLTEMGGDFVDDLRTIAGKQFDQAEQNSKSHRALASVHFIIPIAQQLHFCKYLLKRICHSKPLAEQLSADLDYVFSTEAKLAEKYIPEKMKDELKEKGTFYPLLRAKTVYSAQHHHLIKGVEKRYANIISRVERLPECGDKEALLVMCESGRAGWAALGAGIQAKKWEATLRPKR